LPHPNLERWRARFQKSANLLASRLDDPPSLAELAAAAAVSPFHFHRLWRELTGETVAKAMLRLRIDASRVLLGARDASISETALAVGFGTSQSFARAFRRVTRQSPSDFRHAARAVESLLPPARVEVVRRGEVLVVALRHTGRYAHLNAVFAEVWSWAERSQALQSLSGIYGIPHDDPASLAEEELRYDACLALEVDEAPAPFRLLRLPGGEYLRAEHAGSYDALEEPTQALMGWWLEHSARELRDHPIIYRYAGDPEVTPVAELRTEILLPLAGDAP
jgi:AraC family transcriptional regulator